MKNKIVIGNWKMKLTLAESLELTKKLKAKFKNFTKEEVVICPSHIVLDEISKILEDSIIKVGAQNVFWEDSGAFTGEISPGMLVEAGCEYVIVGHSERRKYLLQNYEMIHQEVKAVLNVDNLTPIVCIGEESSARKTDKRDFVLVEQLQQALGGINLMSGQQIIVAYEPVWAIGSGLVIEPAEAEYAHKIIKLALNDIFGMEMVNNNFRIIYGGSINSKNVKDFASLDNIDGFLVGGASLDVDEFYKIAKEIL
ncbi:triose-phosphate isomerase [Candidatus Falkowbacteria bacterium CG11_big_fil_rev_8_21_14_0_20_39_10]|uniref:Triosephosphate isomerase n=1 Tax=Candidatus Falkowbacteria bacterium CG11_big_fil_rev_8_21_14_0_20_39_10 TaxID=1974570 RepID=A0A2M6K9B1_9BACT|nr:MAG: triose-phosphate isomerase [Candidatus Falkowbacteria bacterium CG11_big_fil_rev_8_21_14_0_20_39_10]